MNRIGCVCGFVAALALGAVPAVAQPGDIEPPPPAEPQPPADPQPQPDPEPQPPPQPIQPRGPQPVPVQPGQGNFQLVNPTHHAHVGFFGRVLLGFGFQRITVEDDINGELTISGPAGAFFLSAGLSIKPRLAVHLDLGAVAASNPTIEFNGMETDTEDVTAGVVGIGPGVTYYLPSNAYVAGSLLIGQVSLQADGDEVAESDTGVSVSVMGGKEWWVGSDIGLGVIGQLMLGAHPDGGDSDATLNSVSFTVNFSATYN